MVLPKFDLLPAVVQENREYADMNGFSPFFSYEQVNKKQSSQSSHTWGFERAVLVLATKQNIFQFSLDRESSSFHKAMPPDCKLKYSSAHRIWHFKYTGKNAVLHSPLIYVTIIDTKMLLSRLVDLLKSWISQTEGVVSILFALSSKGNILKHPLKVQNSWLRQPPIVLR